MRLRLSPTAGVVLVESVLRGHVVPVPVQQPRGAQPVHRARHALGPRQMHLRVPRLRVEDLLDRVSLRLRGHVRLRTRELDGGLGAAGGATGDVDVRVHRRYRDVFDVQEANRVVQVEAIPDGSFKVYRQRQI